jgi:hypothetical protein
MEHLTYRSEAYYDEAPAKCKDLLTETTKFVSHTFHFQKARRDCRSVSSEVEVYSPGLYSRSKLLRTQRVSQIICFRLQVRRLQNSQFLWLQGRRSRSHVLVLGPQPSCSVYLKNATEPRDYIPGYWSYFTPRPACNLLV